LAAQRNRSLLEVKKDLEEVKENFDNKYKFKNIQTKINYMIEGKDNWKVFETNFNEINDDFFHDLLLKYPTLSTKDLKLCAYLKMNLTTKEIAPLMAISVRGVEIHRYRLRKKFNLKAGKNLSKFLISNY
ncbi:MAG: LuxR C-terminal-related transcriptional regulator, partial [Leeuwenhoekiella sp.]